MITHIEESLQKFIGRTPKISKSLKILSLWESVIGEKIRRNTEPIKLRAGTLYISAKSSVWAQELSLLKTEIIAKLNMKAGEEIVRDIRFRA